MPETRTVQVQVLTGHQAFQMEKEKATFSRMWERVPWNSRSETRKLLTLNLPPPHLRHHSKCLWRVSVSWEQNLPVICLCSLRSSQHIQEHTLLILSPKHTLNLFTYLQCHYFRVERKLHVCLFENCKELPGYFRFSRLPQLFVSLVVLEVKSTDPRRSLRWLDSGSPSGQNCSYNNTNIPLAFFTVSTLAQMMQKSDSKHLVPQYK